MGAGGGEIPKQSKDFLTFSQQRLRADAFEVQRKRQDTLLVHLTLVLGSQVGAPADDLPIFASSAEQGASLQRAQGVHAALVRFVLSHDLEGL